MSTKTSTREAMAGTLRLAIDELDDYEYQPGRESRKIYAVGDYYYCLGKKPPGDTDLKWERHPDQFWAERAGTVAWRTRRDA